ncbi:hypothetical protein ACWGI9_43760 [Streptomyces sp. NPDC054833]
MREHAARFLPVVDGDGKPVGVVCLGGLATEGDSESWARAHRADAASPRWLRPRLKGNPRTSASVRWLWSRAAAAGQPLT